MLKTCTFCYRIITGTVHLHEGRTYCSVSHLNRAEAARKQVVKDVSKIIRAFNAKHV